MTRLGETVMTARQMENVGAVVEALAFAARPARETGGPRPCSRRMSSIA